MLAPWDLTYTQFLVLTTIADNPRSVRGIGEELGLDSGTLSPLIRRLETRGLVIRSRDREDERIVKVALSADGSAIRTDIEKAVAHLSPAYGLNSDAEGAELIARLNAITAGMHALTTSTRATSAA